MQTKRKTLRLEVERTFSAAVGWRITAVGWWMTAVGRRITLYIGDLVSLQRLSCCILVFAPCGAVFSVALGGHVTARKLYVRIVL